jgi:serine protease Do
MQNNHHNNWPTHAVYIVVIVALSVVLGAGLVGRGPIKAVNQTPVMATPEVNRSGLAAFQQAFSDIVSKTAPSVVNINTEQTVQVEDPYDQFLRQNFGLRSPYTYSEKRTSLGSGMIITEDGYILTNGHVVSGAEQISVKLSDGKAYRAQFIAGNPKRDLAIIKIDAGRKLTPVRFGNADTTRVGSWAIAVGSPFGLAETVTVGVVSAKGRVLASEEGAYQDLLQTDASINPGNSGGPLLNLNGEVIGVNQAIYSPSGVGNIGIGFAIPLNRQTQDLINQLKASKK